MTLAYIILWSLTLTLTAKYPKLKEIFSPIRKTITRTRLAPSGTTFRKLKILSEVMVMIMMKKMTMRLIKRIEIREYMRKDFLGKRWVIICKGKLWVVWKPEEARICWLTKGKVMYRKKMKGTHQVILLCKIARRIFLTKTKRSTLKNFKKSFKSLERTQTF